MPETRVTASNHRPGGSGDSRPASAARTRQRPRAREARAKPTPRARTFPRPLPAEAWPWWSSTRHVSRVHSSALRVVSSRSRRGLGPVWREPQASALSQAFCGLVAVLFGARWARHLDKLPSWLAGSSQAHDRPSTKAHATDRKSSNGGFLPHWFHWVTRLVAVLGRLVVAADVTQAVAERTRHLERADDLSATPVAFWAVKPVSQEATPVPLHVGHVTQRRFLNFSPFPVSHHPPSPPQPEQGFGFGSLLLGMPRACALAYDESICWSAIPMESVGLGVQGTRAQGRRTHWPTDRA